MAKVAIIGAGFAGHTAAIYLGNSLGRDHEIIMINKSNYFLYLPSLVWVGVGHMAPDKVQCPCSESMSGSRSASFRARPQPFIQMSSTSS